MNLINSLRQKIQNIAQTRRAQNFSLFIFVVGCVVLYFQAYVPYDDGLPFDLRNYISSSQQIIQGESPYGLDTEYPFLVCPYPLFFGFVFYPLTLLPEAALTLIWYLITLAALVWSVKIILDFYHNHTNTSLLFYIFIFSVFSYSFIQNNFKNAQHNTLLLITVLLCFTWMQRNRLLAGAMLGSAVAIKLVPIVLLIYFALRRDWKMLVSSIGWSLFFLFLPVITMGSEIFAAYKNYLFYFLLDHSHSTHTEIGLRIYSNLYDVVSALSGGPDLNAYGMLFIIILTLVVFIWIDWRSMNRGLHSHSLWHFSLYLYLPILLSPISEKHHFVLLLPSFLFMTLRFFLMERTLVARDLLFPLGLTLLFSARFFEPTPIYGVAVILLTWAHTLFLREVASESVVSRIERVK